jgi:imidazolonepropionase-like amidohydrolase
MFSIIAISLSLDAVPSQASNGGQSLAIRAGRIMTVVEGVIDEGVILARDGKIVGVGTDITIPDGTPVIDANGMTIVPGFVDAHSHLGLSLNVRGEIDETVQPVTAEMQIIDAFDATADDLGTAVRSGVTAAMLAPGRRNPIGGQTATVKLAGSGPDAWLLRRTAGVKFSFANDALMSTRRPTSRPGLMTLLTEHLDKAGVYTPETFDPSAEILNRLVERELPVYAYAQTVDEISAALHIIDQYKLRAVLVGAHYADEMADMFVEREIPVICGPLLLRSKDKDIKRVVNLANAGVKVAFASFAPTTSAGDIRMSAILAVRYGLSPEEALKTLTQNAADMLGLTERLGSIRNGCDADLVLFNGDPMEPSSQVKMVIVDGKVVYRRESK